MEMCTMVGNGNGNDMSCITDMGSILLSRYRCGFSERGKSATLSELSCGEGRCLHCD